MSNSITDPFVFPFDPTGTLQSNKITNEQHIVTPLNWRDYNVFVPKQGPFFADTFKLSFRDVDGNRIPLEEGRDWYATHQYIGASRATMKPIYGSFTLLRNDLKGVVTIDKYQTLGGKYSIDEAQIATILADKIHNPRTTSYEWILEIPTVFPPIDHNWDLVDMVGMSELVDAVLKMTDAVLQMGEGGLAAHLANHNNPHFTTKVHVGLSNVQNYDVASDADAIAGTSSTLYMTPRAVSLSIQNQLGTNFNEHIQNFLNPHKVTAAQTGAYSTQQVDTLLQGKLSTTAAAYDTLRIGGQTPIQYKADVLSGTAANASKVYGFTLAQLKAEIQGGASADSDMLGGMTPTDLMAWILTGTAANAMKLNGRTDAQVRDWILSNQCSDSYRFNGLTYLEAAADILSGKAADSFRFGGFTPDEFRNTITSATASNALRLEGRTTDELKNYILLGTSANTNAIGGMNLTQLQTQILAGTCANTLAFGNMNVDAFVEYVLRGTAAGTYTFDGKTSDEWYDYIDTAADANAAQFSFDGVTGETGTGNRWLTIGTMTVPKTIVASSLTNDALIMVAGGEADGAVATPLSLMQLSLRNGAVGTVGLSVQPMTTVNNLSVFGYTRVAKDASNDLVTVYYKVPLNRSRVTITEYSNSSFVMTNDPTGAVSTTEPAGIIYTTPLSAYVSANDFAAYKTSVDQGFNDLAKSFDDLTKLITG